MVDLIIYIYILNYWYKAAHYIEGSTFYDPTSQYGNLDFYVGWNGCTCISI